ncbi:MAG: dicarboxylate/amino acid:cation symporter [Planctomycetia bacterium]|nr:dicarboxylate/amino acid:cation symporter [Planctomycetia bacterium]
MMNFSKNENNRNHYFLDDKNIKEVVKQIKQYLEIWKVDVKDSTQYCMMAEETLLIWQEHFGSNKAFHFEAGRKIGGRYFCFSLTGESYDPLHLSDKVCSEYNEIVLSHIGVLPNWNYSRGVNIVTFTPIKKDLSVCWILFALAVGLLCGWLGVFLPNAFREAALNNFLLPVANTFIGLLTTVAGPLIFLCVIWGICSVGDIMTLNLLGKRMLGRFLLFMFFSVVLAVVICGPFCSISSFYFQESGNTWGRLWQMILDIVPHNVVSPFSEGNSLQIVFLDALFGTAILAMGKRSDSITKLVEQANYLLQMVMNAVSKLIAIFVFVSIVSVFWSGNMNAVLSSWKIPCFYIATLFIILTFELLRFSVAGGVQPFVLLKKMAPTILIAFTTASSMAAYSTNMETCRKKLGIDERIVNFGIPFGMVMFKTGHAVIYIILPLFIANIYGMDLSFSMVASLIIMATLLGVATPPIPGGGLCCYTILFLQAGIPTEALSVAAALDVIFDRFATMSNLGCLQVELAMLAKRQKMLDLTILRKF